MNVAQTILYMLGAVLVVGGIALLFVESGPANWISIGIALAGLLVIVDMLVMGFSGHGDKDTKVTHVEHHTRRDD